MKRAAFAHRASLLKAMAHPTRLMILELLSGGERCVCEIHAIVGSDLTTVSKHLCVLRNAGLVGDERRGQQVFYRSQIPCLGSFLDCVDAMVARRWREQFKLGAAEQEVMKR